ncbi:aminotransferase class I/II-fold pyridoxal phosphate-dependent enzyme [Vogesella sp. DC21W]|uniref:Aminotransferase class I/II-fold pyridoxal phosphate-dependent enzyme n=1 Tax=Vogesella aquatica TaxID=2984206 RepID=A0ABT5IVR7_9NEIS|nr:aminotransferase class I/II-fold pyridoxal phosphate-dependent enzyme [Vogesella aquatica]MDC7716286.1 aminotransferase class I/II-fold pyridoxal phosphate-dependent enzyme [Vogesella aquatica]
MTRPTLHPDTLAVRAGEDPFRPHDALAVPVEFAIAHGYPDVASWEQVARGDAPGPLYSRNTAQPATLALEARLAALEGAEAAVAFSSGMAAISSTLMALLRPGARVVAGKDTYGGSHYLFQHTLPHWGVQVTLCDTTDAGAFAAAMAQGCDLLYLESPTNPMLKVQDIHRLAAAGHAAGAWVVIDNTFATPVNQQPLALGADLVLHSATKFLGGHADAMGGIACGSRALTDQLRHYREIHGACLDPMSAFLILRGIKTLALRMRQHNANALALAQWLQAHPAVARVNYPGLPDHPQHALAASQMQGFGGVLSFELAGGFAAVQAMLPRCQLLIRAATLGSVDTLLGIPSTTSHVECSEAERVALGIPGGLVRCSVGIEDVRDLIADLAQALA